MPMKRCLGVVGSVVALLLGLSPAYASNEYGYAGGVFIILFGGVVFLCSFVVVFYFLLRSPSQETGDDEDSDA